MAYDKTKPPALQTDDVGNQSIAYWSMRGTDTQAAVAVNGYISNGRDLGMKRGDILDVFNTGTNPPQLYTFIVAAVNPNGSLDLSDGQPTTASANAT